MHRYVVLRATRVTSSVLVLDLQLAEGERTLAFEPGQYAAISFHRRGRPTAARCFSVASSPTEQGRLQFGIRLAGHFTQSLAAIQPGAMVTVRGPFGRFILRTDVYREVVLCAGGIGITPLLSMVRYASAIQASVNVTLIYSIRGQTDAPFLTELRELASRNPRLKLIFVCGDGPSDQLAPFPVFTGRVSADVLKMADPSAQSTYFLCGPPPFMKAVTGLLTQRGIAKSDILSEAFSQGSMRQTSRRWSWPVNMYAMGAVGTITASMGVLATDILKTLPASLMPEILSSTSSPAAGQTSQRQQDLDALVNTLPAPVAVAATSPALAQAEALAIATTPAPAPAATVQPTTTKTSASRAPTVSAPAATAAPIKINPTPVLPAPTPVPVCTTTQSGVTQC